MESSTTISTESYFITIKPWKDYTLSFTELVSTSSHRNRVAAFFGENQLKSDIISLFHKYQLDVWELTSSSSGITVHIHSYNQNYHDDDKTELPKWIEQHYVINDNQIKLL